MIEFIKKIFGIKTVDFRELVNKGAVIIDVRSPMEFKSGSIKGAKNYPVESIRNKVADIKKLNKPVITVCRSGARSSMAKSILKSAGIEAYNGGPWTSLQSKIR
ncbi:MAG: rhodanese-like domain-containing protein [Chitinophagaceae bacterium]|nr:rhodanese-like domain-containing protein [Chitinophagaceae bacterium]MBK8951385.1 rhodanese-like domain-containing protein [Chitinophagaceae bacterium]